MSNPTNWEADKMLDVYIYDYLVKRNLQASAKAFQVEGNVSSDPVAIDAPGGFLFEWWSVFWDIFIARTNEKHSEVAASYIETQVLRVREQQMQQLQPQAQNQQPKNQQQQMQIQQFLQRQVQQQQQQLQQQQREGHINGPANGLIGSDPSMRQTLGTANALATKMYADRLKLPHQRDSMDDSASNQRFSDNVGQFMDNNHTSVLKSGAVGQSSGQVLHGTAGGMSGSAQQVQTQNQQLPGSTQDMKNDMNQVLNPRAAGLDGSLIGIPGSNQGGNNLTLRGWPVTGIDQLRPGILQTQKSFVQSPPSFQQVQMLTPQQQQLLIQAQSLNSPPGNDTDSRRLRMMASNRNMGLSKDGQSSSVGDVVQNVGSPMQAPGSVLPRDQESSVMKRLAHAQSQQNSNQQLQQLQQHALSSQQSQSSSHHLHQQDKVGGAGSVTADGSMSNSFRGNDQTGRKRKQTMSSGPANSTGTANTAGPSPGSAPSTPSTHTPGDAISMPTLPPTGSSSKPMTMFGPDGSGTLPSASNQLANFVEDGSPDDNVESFIREDNDPHDTVGRGFTFSEMGFFRASTSKVISCHFSSDGKLLATAGHDKKAVLWHTDSFRQKAILEEHTSLITDVRFSPTSSRLATSSFDKTVRVWDSNNHGYSIRTFTGHSGQVMSLDFHPKNDDLICSCDSESEIRYWSITNGTYARVFKGGSTQMRFQPHQGRYLATATENIISILDVETQVCRHSLQGHSKLVHSVCWDPSGNYMASVSEDSVRLWTFGSGNEGECVRELSNGNKFQSCVFHPTFPSLLVIGCYQSLELWNTRENKTMTLAAHEGLISSLAVSNVTNVVASASHDKFVKLWK